MYSEYTVACQLSISGYFLIDLWVTEIFSYFNFLIHDLIASNPLGMRRSFACLYLYLLSRSAVCCIDQSRNICYLSRIEFNQGFYLIHKYLRPFQTVSTILLELIFFPAFVPTPLLRLLPIGNFWPRHRKHNLLNSIPTWLFQYMHRRFITVHTIYLMLS